MEKTILNLNEITEICDYFVNAPYPYYEVFREMFVVLMLTGCRPEEVFSIGRWTYISGYDCELQPCKSNNVRFVTLSSSTPNFIESVKNQTPPFMGLSIHQAQNLFNKVKLFNYLYSGDGIFTLYIYRYRFIKQLYADGVPLVNIASILGYTSTSTPQSYIDAVIEMGFDSPPSGTCDINGNIIEVSNCSVSDGGPGIYYPFNSFHVSRFLGLLYSQEAAFRIADNINDRYIPDWNTISSLKNYIATQPIDGNYLKSVDTRFWMPSNVYARNAYGFNWLPAGYHASGVWGNYNNIGYFWIRGSYHVFYAKAETWPFYMAGVSSNFCCSVRLFCVV